MASRRRTGSCPSRSLPGVEERELRSRLSWIVGLLLATAFVGTVIWSVAQDTDDDDDGGDQGGELTFDGVGEPIDPDVVLPEPVEPLSPDMYALTVHEDGCGVIRSEVPVDAPTLTWVIEDQDGFQVLGRNALGEDRYRYFQGGTYTVVLEAFGDGAYGVVSNRVTISC